MPCHDVLCRPYPVQKRILQHLFDSCGHYKNTPELPFSTLPHYQMTFRLPHSWCPGLRFTAAVLAFELLKVYHCVEHVFLQSWLSQRILNGILDNCFNLSVVSQGWWYWCPAKCWSTLPLYTHCAKIAWSKIQGFLLEVLQVGVPVQCDSVMHCKNQCL